MGHDSSDGPADEMYERASKPTFVMQVLVALDRKALAAVLLLFILVCIAWTDELGFVSLAEASGNGDPFETLFQGLVGAIITGVTLVVTISQLVLSQELGAVGDQWERMRNSLDFRSEVEQHIGVPAAPPEPSAFLQMLAQACADQARELVDTVGRSDKTERLCQFADALVENAEQVAEDLDGAQFGTFSVISAALDLNYSWKIYLARRIWTKQEWEDDEHAAFDRLIQTLTYFAPAREHFKTLYFEWELINLSRGMIYLAVPALLVAILSVLFLGTADIPTGTLLGVTNLAWVLAVAITIAVSPFMLLLSYILRIVTVAKLTLAMGPFILRETNRDHTIRRH